MDVHYDFDSKVISTKANDFFVEDRGLGWHFLNCMKKHGNCVAQIYADTGEKETFSALLHRCIRLAISLRNLDVKPGDVVTICSYSTLNSVVPHVASQFIGAVISSTDPTISLEDHKHLLGLVKPKVVFISNDTRSLIVDTLAAIGLSAILINFDDNFKELVAPQDGEDRFEPYTVKNLGDTAFIHFSSGTTGLAKAFCLSHKFMFFNRSNLNSVWSGDGGLLCYATTYWISTSIFICTTITKGTARLICSSFDPERIWANIEKYNVQIAFLAASQAIKALKYLPANWKGRLEYLLVGGSPVTKASMDELVAALPKTIVFQGYGMTETGFSTSGFINGTRAKLTSCGLPLPGIEYKIVDEESETSLGFNEQGEIRIKSPHPMNGYYNKDSSSCWDKDGFLKTGDVGYYDEDFNFFITDRSKEMFKYISWHIVPAKLEAILMSHPEVQEAAVIGIPHVEDDNHAMGLVVVNKGSSVTGEELEKFVEGLVDERNRLRAGVRVLDQLLYTPSGKIKKRDLRDLILKETIV